MPQLHTFRRKRLFFFKCLNMMSFDVAAVTMAGNKFIIADVAETDQLITLKRRIGVALGVAWYLVVVCLDDKAFDATYNGKTLRDLDVRSEVVVVLQSPWQESDSWLQLSPQTEYPHTRTQFQTLFNGGRNFVVTAFPQGSPEGTVLVENADSDAYLEIQAQCMFVGKDSSLLLPDFIGNSILLQLQNNPGDAFSYAFIGEVVYTFESDEPILHYFSQVGNNDVPYPVALGPSKVFFMLDTKFIMRAELREPCDFDHWEASYSDFYERGSSVKFPFKKLRYVSIT